MSMQDLTLSQHPDKDRAMTTAADIRASRARLDETQAEFGKRFGVDRSTIAIWEKYGPPGSGTAAALIKRVLSEIVTELREAQ